LVFAYPLNEKISVDLTFCVPLWGAHVPLRLRIAGLDHSTNNSTCRNSSSIVEIHILLFFSRHFNHIK
jgi:hypothetical protein